MEEEKKNNKFNVLIVIVFVLFIIIFLVIFYIKKSSNNIENFKQPVKNKPINTQDLIMEQIKNFNKEESSPDFLDKNFFEDIKQSNVINDIKKNIDNIQTNLKKYKEEDVKEIKENIEYIKKKLNNEKELDNEKEVDKPKETVEKVSSDEITIKNPETTEIEETPSSSSSLEPIEMITSLDI